MNVGEKSSSSKPYRQMPGSRRSPASKTRDALTQWTEQEDGEMDVLYGLGEDASIGPKNDGGEFKAIKPSGDDNGPDRTGPRKASAQPGGGW